MANELFPETKPCEHGRSTSECPWCANARPDPPRLARSSDPATSKAAAASLNLKLTAKHIAVLDLYRQQGPMTDDEAAIEVVDAGITVRHEQARRLVRTLREQHLALVPYRGVNTSQLERRNASGRMARVWTVSSTVPDR